MARRRKKGGDASLIVLVLIVGAVAAVPKEIWVLLGVLAVVAAIIWFVRSAAGTAKASPDSVEPPPVRPKIENTIQKLPRASTIARPSPIPEPRPQRSYAAEQPVAIYPAEGRFVEHRLPAAPKGLGPARWVAPGESVTIQGHSISGGMIYVGGQLLTLRGQPDPCLINPELSAKPGEAFGLGYWPSYAQLHPAQRATYLRWLASGRIDPSIDVGYVFLFFYGLERRALVDAKTDTAASGERPQLIAEVERLLTLYGPKSSSLRRYAGRFLDWLQLVDLPADLHRLPLPAIELTREIPLRLRLVLALIAREGSPVPPAVALAWVRQSAEFSGRNVVTRCPEVFEQQFQEKYRRAFGNGMTLPHNRTKLVLEYQPASGAFVGAPMVHRFEGLHDVTVLTGPIGKLSRLADETVEELAPYARALGKEVGHTPRLESVLSLQPSLWPEPFRKNLDGLKRRVGAGVLGMTNQELHAALGGRLALTRERFRLLAKALETEGIGIEPDVLADARMPKPEDPVVLFDNPVGPAVSRKTAEYQAAQLMLQLSAAVAVADGVFGPEEMRHLAAQVRNWAHLTPAQQRRLMAHLRLQVMEPSTLASLKKRVEPLSADAKEAIAEFMVATAHADGRIDPAEVKLLEKAYRALSIDPKRVFGDLHGVETAAPASTVASSAGATAPRGLQLDPARVAALQQETARVSALLSSIFTADEEPLSQSVEPVEPESIEASEVSSGLLGLDSAHTAFVRALLARPHWSREDAGDVAADLDLMLDGALERVNEAAFEQHDQPLIEGDDPLELNADLVEILQA